MVANPLSRSVEANLQNAARLVRDTIGRFTPEQWVAPAGGLRSAARIAWHLVEALNFYFKENAEKYVWGTRFGRPEWETADASLPTQQAMVEFLDEIVGRASAMLVATPDDQLAQRDPGRYRHGETRLEHYIYALRHTMHHAGQLSAIAVAHGHRGLLWA